MSYDEHFKLAVDLSKEALKAVFLLNAGAATALIALMDKTNSHYNYSLAIIFFGVGVLLSTASFCLAYFSQLWYANHRMSADERDPSAANKHYRRHSIYQTLAIVSTVLAVVVASIGIGLAMLEVVTKST